MQIILESHAEPQRAQRFLEIIKFLFIILSACSAALREVFRESDGHLAATYDVDAPYQAFHLQQLAGLEVV